MRKKTLILAIISLFFLAFQAIVAHSIQVEQKKQQVFCRAAPWEERMKGRDAPGRRRLFLLPGDKVDINRAGKEELKLLPGIGDVLAERILAFREKEAFGKPEDLMQVKGIGEATYAAMAPYIIIGETS